VTVEWLTRCGFTVGRGDGLQVPCSVLVVSAGRIRPVAEWRRGSPGAGEATRKDARQ
jgi:hypothetical protein